jgi:hypothetical protein
MMDQVATLNFRLRKLEFVDRKISGSPAKKQAFVSTLSRLQFALVRGNSENLMIEAADSSKVFGTVSD